MNLYLLQQYKFIQHLYKDTNYLDVMMNIDDFLDILHIYSFPNWYDAELVNVKFMKYYTNIILKAERSSDKKKDKCPDPKGGIVLTKYDCKVEYTKTSEVLPVDVKTKEDLVYDSRRDRYIPKTEKRDIWLVDILIPNKHIINDNIYDLEAIQSKLEEEDEQDDKMESVVSNNDEMGEQ